MRIEIPSLLAWAFFAFATQPPPQTRPQEPPLRPGPVMPTVASLPKSAEPVERLGENLFRVGNVRIDTARREISVAGTVNDVRTLEFIASTKGGFKSYESLLELDTNAINFNLALILIGLDKDHAVVPRFHFDPIPPQGDPVEVWIEWTENGAARRVRAEQLVYNERTKQTLPEGPWVYTGSVFISQTNAYLADMDGTLIGFVHTPSPILENPSPVPTPYDANHLNPALNLKPGTAVRTIVRAIAKPKA